MSRQYPQGTTTPYSNYRRGDKIGSGTYGIIYKGIHIDSKRFGTNYSYYYYFLTIYILLCFCRVVALKRVILHNEQVLGFPLTTLREISLLKQCKHVNIVQLIDIIANERKDSIYLVLEYCDFDLHGLLDDVKYPFTESQIKTLIIQLFSALQYLHENGIIHRDIKLSNLLYNSFGQLKLADFGLGRKYTSKINALTPVVVTLHYRSPELLMNCTNYDYAIDIWAVGCVIFELFTNEVLFNGGDQTLTQLFEIFKILGAPNTTIWPELSSIPLYTGFEVVLASFQEKWSYNELNSKSSRISTEGYEFINRCLTYSPKKRITAREALSHTYLTTACPLPTDAALMPTFKK